MSSIGLPTEAAVRPGEILVGEWELVIPLKGSHVAEIHVVIRLTSERLVILNLPIPRPVSWLTGKLSRGPDKGSFMEDMGKWHVMLAASLATLPEPRVEVVRLGGETAAPSRRAIVIGEGRYWVGDDSRAEEIVRRILAQRRALQAPIGDR